MSVKKQERVEVPVTMVTDNVALLKVNPDKDGVWVKRQACMFSDDETVARITKRYYETLVERADERV